MSSRVVCEIRILSSRSTKHGEEYMPPRSPQKYLYDIVNCCEFVLEMTKDRTVEDYKRDRVFRSALERELQIIGVGYRAEMQGEKLILYLGYSHPIEFPLPPGINVKVERQTRGIQNYVATIIFFKITLPISIFHNN